MTAVNPYEPAVRDAVVIMLAGSDVDGDVGEIQEVLPGAVAVRIVQEESPWNGRLVYFHKSQLRPVLERG